MKKEHLIAILSLIFIIASLFAIMNFTTLTDAKWADNGMDMAYGIILIVLFGFLYKAYKLTKDKNILTIGIGFLIMAFVRVFEIFLQEYQISINYTPPPWGLWALSYLITGIGVVLVIKGLIGGIKK